MKDSFILAFNHLQTTAAVNDITGTMQAANDLSAAVIDLFDLYHPLIPTDIGRLDVLERQIILDITTNNFTAATDSLAKVKTVWERVKPSILAHNGNKVAKEFEIGLTAQSKALDSKNANALKNETQNGLEIVDALEKVY